VRQKNKELPESFFIFLPHIFLSGLAKREYGKDGNNGTNGKKSRKTLNLSVCSVISVFSVFSSCLLFLRNPDEH
jgi:hypothetical protein